jgi:protein tyrosine/serine phosphatase
MIFFQKAQPAPKVNPKDLPNFALVAPGIYRGAAPTTKGLEELKKLGVVHVIDLRIERKGQDDEATTAKRLGFQRTRIRMGREAPTEKQVKTFIDIIRQARTKPVFVHCQHGADRTGAMIGIYRAVDCGWKFDDIWKEMRHYGFKTYLDDLKDSVRKRVKR